VLVLDAGSPLDVEIDGWPAGASGLARLAREDDGQSPRSVGAAVHDCRVRFEGLDAAATYTLWVPAPLTANVCVLATGLRPGADGIRVAARESRDLRVRCESQEPSGVVSVSASGPGFQIGYRLVDGEPVKTVHGVPAWLSVHVTVLARSVMAPPSEDPGLIGEADVSAGATEVEVTLAARPR
jgi:hypothetical protein